MSVEQTDESGLSAEAVRAAWDAMRASEVVEATPPEPIATMAPGEMNEEADAARRYRQQREVEREFEEIERTVTARASAGLDPVNAGAYGAPVVGLGLRQIDDTAVALERGEDPPEDLRENLGFAAIERLMRAPIGGTSAHGGGGRGRSRKRSVAAKDRVVDPLQEAVDDARSAYVRFRVYGLQRGVAEYFERHPGEAASVLADFAAEILEGYSGRTIRLFGTAPDSLARRMEIYGLSEWQKLALQTEPALARSVLTARAISRDIARIMARDRVQPEEIERAYTVVPRNYAA